MTWNPPDPSDYFDQKLATDDLGITYLHLPNGDPYEIRVFHADSTPTVEEFWSSGDFYTRLDELTRAHAEYEIVFGPDDIPF